MPYEYRKLRGRIVEKYGTIGEFSSRVGISINVVSQKLNCKIGFSQKDIEKWASLLDIRKEEYPEYFFT